MLFDAPAHSIGISLSLTLTVAYKGSHRRAYECRHNAAFHKSNPALTATPNSTPRYQHQGNSDLLRSSFIQTYSRMPETDN
ncbi:hypothetical protein TNCV_756641 [Trichonephila clavipes]|nr:hypothetical protein TNCV_756641 [Trichonephila clavipes]